jgi:hypothetical protein
MSPTCGAGYQGERQARAQANLGTIFPMPPTNPIVNHDHWNAFVQGFAQHKPSCLMFGGPTKKALAPRFEPPPAPSPLPPRAGALRR